MNRTTNNNDSFNGILDKELYDCLLNDEEFYLFEEEPEPCLYEDNTYWKSGVDDIEGGDSFIDYCEYIFEILEEEEWYV